MIELRPARRDETTELTALCLRSKAVWGYDAAFMHACRDELTITADDLTSSFVEVAVIDGAVVGVAQVVMQAATADLAKLFVEPSMLRNGAGRALLNWAIALAQANNADTLTIEADPEAAGFYRRMGARDTGMVASGSIPGRMIPRLMIDLAGV